MQALCDELQVSRWQEQPALQYPSHTAITCHGTSDAVRTTAKLGQHVRREATVLRKL